MSLAAAIEVRDDIRACTACSLRQTATAPVPWSGATPASYLILGMAPGYWEDKEGIPWVGPAGGLLKHLLKQAGFRMQDIAYANPVNCFPGRNRKGGDTRPTPDQLKACRVHLLDQIDILQPRFIFLMGTTALEAFRPDLELKYMHGRPMWFDGTDYDRPVTWNARHVLLWSTYHPAAALRSKKYEVDIATDLKGFWEWRRTGEIWPGDVCHKCGREVDRIDHWGVPTCALHSMRQESLPL